MDLQNISSKHVSIVIPAYNEEDSIIAQIKSIKSVMNKTDWSYEVIVVDDGSTDSTAEKAEMLDIKVIRFANNRGYGASLKAGIDKAQSELIVITDADGTYPSEAIPDMLNLSDKYDMVVGARKGDKVSIPLSRKPAKWLLGLLASYLAGIHIPDLNSGLRVLKKNICKTFFFMFCLQVFRLRQQLPLRFCVTSFKYVIILLIIIKGRVHPRYVQFMHTISFC